ncbi:nephrosin isoform 2 precursor, partial [Silurus asotus]
QNADLCTSGGCKWPRRRNGKVYVPYVISNKYSPTELGVIQRAMKSFRKSTCIQFRPRGNETNYIDITSGNGCFSYIGRIRRKQVLSIQINECVYLHVIQHLLLHALGFHHEQSRSDRDKHVKILYNNIRPDKVDNFQIELTNNLKTPYDYNSVMHFERYAFSKSDQPTIIPKPDKNVSIGRATKMSANDILRVKRLYCS